MYLSFIGNIASHVSSDSRDWTLRVSSDFPQHDDHYEAKVAIEVPTKYS